MHINADTNFLLNCNLVLWYILHVYFAWCSMHLKNYEVFLWWPKLHIYYRVSFINIVIDPF